MSGGRNVFLRVWQIDDLQFNDSCKRKFKERVNDEIIVNNIHAYFNRKKYDRDLRERICLDAISAAEMKNNAL